MGSRMALPARYFLHDLVTGGTTIMAPDNGVSLEKNFNDIPYALCFGKN